MTSKGGGHRPGGSTAVTSVPSDGTTQEGTCQQMAASCRATTSPAKGFKQVVSSTGLKACRFFGIQRISGHNQEEAGDIPSVSTAVTNAVHVTTSPECLSSTGFKACRFLGVQRISSRTPIMRWVICDHSPGGSNAS